VFFTTLAPNASPQMNDLVETWRASDMFHPAAGIEWPFTAAQLNRQNLPVVF